MLKKLAIKNYLKETALFRERCIAIIILVSLFTSILFVRLSYLQIKNHHYYSTWSRNNILNIIPLPSNRGLIYDRNGILLAQNIPTYTLSVIPHIVKNLDQTLGELSKIIPITTNEIKKFHRILYQYRPYQPVPIKYKLNEEDAARFYIDQYRFPGVIIQPRMMRYYPLKHIMSDVIGYVGRISPQELKRYKSDSYTADDDIGKMGLEKYYEKELKGTPGSEEAEMDATGRIVRVLKENPQMPGKNLYLTIDSRLQAHVEKLLGDESGAVVVMQPQTGEILAMVSKPSYDPNPFVSGLSLNDYQELLRSPAHPLYNRALRGQFAAGSTIKPFFALAGLDEGIIEPEFEIYDPGWFQLPDTQYVYRDWMQNGHKWVNVRKALIVSCDTFFYNLALNMGIDRMNRILYDFGYGQLTGIDMPEEVPGLVPNPKWKITTQGHPWYTGDTIETIIGQGFFLVTPIQLAQAVSALANRGIRVKPHLLWKSISWDGITMTTPTTQAKPVEIQRPHNWDIVINAMRDVVDSPSGTAHFFGPHPGYSVAAKTGTAQIYGHQRDEDINRTNIPKQLQNNHLFIAFAPVEKPQIALAVVVEHSAMADKIAGQIIKYYFEHPITQTDVSS